MWANKLRDTLKNDTQPRNKNLIICSLKQCETFSQIIVINTLSTQNWVPDTN